MDARWIVTVRWEYEDDDTGRITVIKSAERDQTDALVSAGILLAIMFGTRRRVVVTRTTITEA